MAFDKKRRFKNYSRDPHNYDSDIQTSTIEVTIMKLVKV